MQKLNELAKLEENAEDAEVNDADEAELTTILVTTLLAKWNKKVWSKHMQPLRDKQLKIRKIAPFRTFYDEGFVAQNRLYRESDDLQNFLSTLTTEGSQDGSVASRNAGKKKRQRKRGEYSPQLVNSAVEVSHLEEGEVAEGEQLHGVKEAGRQQKGNKPAGDHCNGCDRDAPRHVKASCRWSDHPNFNRQDKPWAESAAGLGWSSQHQSEFLQGVSETAKATWLAKVPGVEAKIKQLSDKRLTGKPGKKPKGKKGGEFSLSTTSEVDAQPVAYCEAGRLPTTNSLIAR